MKKIIFIIFGICVLVFLLFQMQSSETLISNKPTLQLRTHTLLLEVVNTPETRLRGLGGHTPLSDKEGMFFLFNEPSIQTFWMKDMTFPIDIVWLSECSGDHAVVAGIEEKIDPQIGAKNFELKLYTSPQPVACVFEVRGGLMNAWGARVGDSVSFTSNLVK